MSCRLTRAVVVKRSCADRGGCLSLCEDEFIRMEENAKCGSFWPNRVAGPMLIEQLQCFSKAQTPEAIDPPYHVYKRDLS